MIGTILNQRFTITEELGRGGSGVVYRAHDEKLDRHIAIKILSHLNLDAEGSQKLLREAKSIAKLNHPNIVSVYDAGEEDNTPYIVMEYVEGKTLHDAPPTDFTEIVAIAAQICQALDHAHSHDIVHRDLKPENVIIGADGTAKLMDFGIARSIASRVTSEGEVIGTVFYLAPEIALGREYDGRADLYALGVMLYELTTGDLPFADGDPVAVISQHLHASVLPPRSKSPDVPPRLDALIIQMMSKSPTDRPISAVETLRLLQRDDLLEMDAGSEGEVLVLDRIVRGRFVGRVNELAEAQALWNKAISSEGQTLLISGEPGIGKTRLLRELSTHAEVSGGTSLIGACYVEGGPPYAPFAQIVRQVLSDDANNGVTIPDFVVGGLLDLAPELKPSFPEVPEVPALEPEAERQRLYENVVTLCSTLSEEGPLLLTLEDAHWADSGSLGLFQHLARRIRNKPVMLVASYREAEIERSGNLRDVLLELNRQRLAHRLNLSRLSREQTESLLAVIFQEEVTPEFLDAIFEKSEGNPFFIEEICKALIEGGQVFHTDVGWDRIAMKQIEIPRGVREVIMARVGKLPELYQDVLTLAAVLGREFEVETLASASEQDEETLIMALEAAEDAQLILELKGDSDVEFSFAHALIPSTLVENTRSLRRRKLHESAARAIKALHPQDYERLAQHYAEAGNIEKAFDYYEMAGDRAAEAYANQEAEQHYRAAIELAESEMVNAELLSKLALIVNLRVKHEEAIGLWEQAASIYSAHGDLSRVAWCYARMGRARWDSGNEQAALDICLMGVSKTEGSPESPELADLIHECARSYLFLGNEEQAEKLCTEALGMARRTRSPKAEADALTTYAMLLSRPADEAIEHLNEAIEISMENDLPKLETRARHNLAIVIAVDTGRIRDSLQQVLKNIEIERRIGNVGSELVSLVNASFYAGDLGDLAQATEFVSILRKLGDQLVESGVAQKTIEYGVSNLYWVRGELDAATEGLRQGWEYAKRGESLNRIQNRGEDFTRVLTEIGELDEALVVSDSVVEALGPAGRVDVFTRAPLAIIQARLGNKVAARASLDLAESYFEQKGGQLRRIVIDRAEAHVLVAEARWEEAWQLFEATAERYAKVELRLLRARILIEWADARLSRGETDDFDRANELLLEIRDEFSEMGASGYVKRIDAKLSEIEGFSG